MSLICENHFYFKFISFSITSLSLIDPPGCIIVLILYLLAKSILSENGKKASEASIEFSVR